MQTFRKRTIQAEKGDAAAAAAVAGSVADQKNKKFLFCGDNNST